MPPGTGTQTRRILITVDTKGNRDIQDLANKLGSVSKNTKSLKENVQALTGVFSGWVAFLGVREIARMSDEMQNLSNRLKIVSRQGEDTTQTLQKILQLANETNQSVAETSEIYVRLGSSLKAANVSADSLLEITKALVNSFRVSGSTGTETTATIVQLSQAFASGTLRGQELRSVMLQNAELASLLRQRFGKNLAKDAEAGLISIVEVLKLLRANQERINAQALILAPTFEQTITKAFNKARFAIFQLNEEFKLSAKFAAGMDAVVNRLSLIATVAGALALTQIPLLIKSLQALRVATVALVVGNPLGTALVAATAILIATNKSLGDFIDKLRNVGAWLVQFAVWADQAALAAGRFLDKIRPESLKGRGEKELQERIKSMKALAEELGTKKYGVSTNPLDAVTDKGKSDAEFEALLKRLEKMYGATEKAKKVKEILGDLNTAFASGAITIQDYNNKLVNFELFKLNKEFREGKFDIFAYNEKMRQLKEQDYNRQFREGAITLKEYNAAIDGMKLDELKSKFDAGKISAADYNDELVKISRQFEPGGALMSGTKAYMDSIGTLSSNIADGIRDTFAALETQFLSFIKTGKFNFAEFTQSILDDLAKIIVRASIVRPIADAILSSGIGAGAGSSANSAGGSYTNTSVMAARGMAFDRGIKKFAKGGVVDSPTAFKYGGNRSGIMGEAGPEAILPLSRGKGGNLGVQATVTPVTININNQSSAQVEQTETSGPNGERTIEVLIHNKVKEGIISGKFDKAMKSSYGVNRKGS